MTTIKGKMDVRFPANVAVGNFLTVTKSNGTYTFGVDYTLLDPSAVSDPTTAFIVIDDQTTGSYKSVSLASLITSGVVSPTPITSGGTGATTASDARTNLGLGTMAIQDASTVAITGGTATGFPTPTMPADVAIKSYVDGLTTGLIIVPQVALATAAVLPNTPTYANGASGVGATLTAGSNSTLTVDGSVAALNTVVLVKNQAAPAQNGLYTVTTAGSGAAAWVLTRATYFDTSAEMLAGSYVFVTGGSVNINASYVLQSTVTTVGTTAVNFNQFGSSANAVLSLGGATGIITLDPSLQVAGNVLGPTSPAMILLNTLTASTSATLSDTTSLTGTYSVYELEFINVLSATTSVSAQIQVHSGGAFKTTGYLSTGYLITGTTVSSVAPTTFIPLSLATMSNAGVGAGGLSGTIRVYAPSTSNLHVWTGHFSYPFNTGTGLTTFTTSGAWNTAGVIDGFQFKFSSGNITSGTIKIYGIT